MNETILIVDDEKEIADLIELYLKNVGYTVHKCYNGQDSLKCIGTQKLRNFTDFKSPMSDWRNGVNAECFFIYGSDFGKVSYAWNMA